jgi:EAL domain-containing protein (putative c-di-GMP-specific phosphodiesterase class I)/GGDEF domain-containing protein
VRVLRRLRAKLTLLYAGLFCVALLLIGAIAYAVIAGNAQRMTREQLEATGVVFDRVWELRFEELGNGARLASRDYGFREAVASGDRATIGSALENLRFRLGADLVFLVSLNGAITASDGAGGSAPADLQAALEQDEAPFGVLRVEGRLHQAVATPVFAPNMLGWIVVGERLDEAEMQALQSLSAIPLQAEVISRRVGGGWEFERGAERPSLGMLIDRALEQSTIAAFHSATGDAIVLAKPLHSIDSGRVVLLLRYPMANAMQPYRTLFGSLLAIGIVGVAVLVVGSWLLASGITHPLSSLSAAARQLQHGVYAPVSVGTSDEVSELAESFNTMVAALRDRERKIMHLAFQDSETRLPNRLALERRLAGAKPENLHIAVIGLSRFAQIRTAIGYAHAETLVRLLGARLAQLAPHKLMARLSSDMLAVCYSAGNEKEALQRAAFVASALEQPLSLDGQVIDINVSIGVAKSCAIDVSPADLIRRGSIALDQARSAGQKQAMFDEATYGNPAHNLSLMGEMLVALESGAIYLAHQPKLNLRKQRIESVETLVRWRHPTRGMIPPDLFVPMAEETGQIRALTDWVLRKTIEEQTWLTAQGFPLCMSINVSARLLSDDAFAKSAIAAIRNASGQICFEITETAIIDNPELALRHLETFGKHGVTIAIDDYGSGLSSLAYLRQLPAHELKIDKMFIEDLTRSQKDALLVRSTIDLAHGLGLAVTAEGVEQPAALALLASMGCDMAQGYVIARPTATDDLPDLLTRYESASPSPAKASATATLSNSSSFR